MRSKLVKIKRSILVNFILTLSNIKKCCPIYVDDAKKKQIIELSQKIYGDSKTDDKFYPLIREFNMPKKTVFPEDSLNPKWISSIFVRKEEL